MQDHAHHDADVLFLLTTNRSDDIEDALASRPGRVDEAIEISNPDAACRTRLIALYGAALDFADGAIADAVARSDGSSTAFVKEMVRRLAQAARSNGNDNHVDRSTVAMILGEATESGHRIGRRIVGLPGAVQRAGRAGAPPLDGCGDDL